jgi:hypothetical protein
MNCVMLVKNRPVLTHQALASFRKHTVGHWSLTLVDDASDRETAEMLCLFAMAYPGKVLLKRYDSEAAESRIIGALKNAGVEGSRERFGEGRWLYLSDNDACFLPGWDIRLKEVAGLCEPMRFRLMGGQNHPYHQPIDAGPGYCEYLAVAGTSWLMRWGAWKRYGPLDANAAGVEQSEDTAFCNRVREDGYRVGAVEPPCVIDTGLTQTDGLLSVGHEVKRRWPGVISE